MIFLCIETFRCFGRLDIHSMDACFYCRLWFVPFFKRHFANWLQRSRPFLSMLGWDTPKKNDKHARALMLHPKSQTVDFKMSLYWSIGQRSEKKCQRIQSISYWHVQNICFVDENASERFIVLDFNSISFYSFRFFPLACFGSQLETDRSNRCTLHRFGEKRMHSLCFNHKFLKRCNSRTKQKKTKMQRIENQKMMNAT